MAEPYCLWAIETSSKRTKEILSFAKVDSSVILANNINKYREIKLRLLNAPHTFSCALAVCCGFSTVKQAMQYPAFRSFLFRLMTNEIIPALIGEEIDENEAKIFASKVLDRFANPFIDHEWINISSQYTSKMLMRCIPMLLKHYGRSQNPPGCIALGFAAYILFMNSTKNEQGQYWGKLRGKDYMIHDEKTPILVNHWTKEDLGKVVKSVLSDKSLWNTDLTRLYEFEKLVLSSLQLLKSDGYQKLLHKELITL
jgi:tagaturonate reductase